MRDDLPPFPTGRAYPSNPTPPAPPMLGRSVGTASSEPTSPRDGRSPQTGRMASLCTPPTQRATTRRRNSSHAPPMPPNFGSPSSRSRSDRPSPQLSPLSPMLMRSTTGLFASGPTCPGRLFTRPCLSPPRMPTHLRATSAAGPAGAHSRGHRSSATNSTCESQPPTGPALSGANCFPRVCLTRHTSSTGSQSYASSWSARLWSRWPPFSPRVTTSPPSAPVPQRSLSRLGQPWVSLAHGP
jgi:hypothetical protein